MNRAFVREPDGDAADPDLPDRPLSPHPNYVTTRGLRQLREQLTRLQSERRSIADSETLAEKQRLKEIDRDLRYVTTRIAGAKLVAPSTANDQVRIGCRVEVIDTDGERASFGIVGEDEAEARTGLVSWVSPLACALLEAHRGDVVTWERPDGARELEIIAISALEPDDGGL